MDPSKNEDTALKGTRLEGWKDIAAHLQVSERTAHRWETSTDIPIFREAGNQRPYAWTGTLDAWRNQEAARAAASDPAKGTPHVPAQGPELMRIARVAGLVAAAALVGLAAFFLLRGRPATPSYLTYTVTSRPPGSLIDIYAGDAAPALSLNCPGSDWTQSLGGPPNLCLTDLNGDGLEDVVFAPFYPNNGERVQLYRQTTQRGLRLHQAWSVSEDITYQNHRFAFTETTELTCADLTGDGRPEIIAVMRHDTFYPGLCMVFDQQGRTLFTLRHPGRILSTQVADRNGNGIPELYAAGTNNFLAGNDYSAPIVLMVERPWAQPGAVNLFGPNRTLAGQVPQDSRVVYVSLKKDVVSGIVSDWEGARLTEKPTVELMVAAGQVLQSDVGEFLRFFRFAPDMRCLDGFTAADSLRRLGVDGEKLRASGLYSPVYWNGTSWQETVCAVPLRTR